MTGDNIDLHLTQLATWLVRTIGRAIMWAVLGSVAIAIAGGILNPVLGWTLGGLAGPVLFAWRLMDAAAPFPVEVEKPA